MWQELWSVSPSVDMLPLGVTIPATVPKRSEIPEGLMNNPVYVVALKVSHNHIISEIYKTVPSFKLHYLQYSPPVRLYTCASDCKVVGNIPGRCFFKDFSALS